ncbi:MAG: hypothetical protein ACP5I4_04105 [Oceanipulchritudo sp.]
MIPLYRKGGKNFHIWKMAFFPLDGIHLKNPGSGRVEPPKAPARQMKKVPPLPILMLLLGFVPGCNPSTLMEDLAGDARQATATQYITQLRTGDFGPIVEDMDPEIKPDNVAALLSQMRNFFPPGDPDAVNLVGYQTRSASGQPAIHNLTYQYGFGGQWVLATIRFKEISENRNTILAFNVAPLERPLQETNRFSLEGKGPKHYVFLGLCLAVPVFILATLIACIRTPMKRSKWLWVIFVVVGFGQISINWTTGQIGVNLLNIQLFGAAAMASNMYAPWILSISLPLGALLFWIRRDKLRALDHDK